MKPSSLDVKIRQSSLTSVCLIFNHSIQNAIKQIQRATLRSLKPCNINFNVVAIMNFFHPKNFLFREFPVLISIISISTFVAFVLVVSGVSYLYYKGKIIIPRQTQHGQLDYIYMPDECSISSVSLDSFTNSQNSVL